MQREQMRDNKLKKRKKEKSLGRKGERLQGLKSIQISSLLLSLKLL